MLKLQMTGVSSVFYEESAWNRLQVQIMTPQILVESSVERTRLLNRSYIKHQGRDMKWGILEQHAYSGNLGTSLLKAIIKGETLEYNSTVRTIVPTS